MGSFRHSSKTFDPFLLSMALLQIQATFYIEKSMEKALLLKIVKYGWYQIQITLEFAIKQKTLWTTFNDDK